jgi:transcriptional regulator with XRE-family HTH domain
MTTQVTALPGGRDESYTEAVSRRLRGQLAEMKISAVRLADMIGMSRAAIGRRLLGETALNTDELAAISRATGISLSYLTTGIAMSPQPGGPDGGYVLPSRLTESNRRPSHYRRLIAVRELVAA